MGITLIMQPVYVTTRLEVKAIGNALLKPLSQAVFQRTRRAC
jgi:hypothetical protein